MSWMIMSVSVCVCVCAQMCVYVVLPVCRHADLHMKPNLEMRRSHRKCWLQWTQPVPLIQLISTSFYCSKTLGWIFFQLCWSSPCWIKVNSFHLMILDYICYKSSALYHLSSLRRKSHDWISALSSVKWNKMVTNPRYMHIHACVQVLACTHCVKVVEEADASWVRWFQGELEERFHVQGWGWDDRWAPEEGRDWPCSVDTSCGRCTNRKIRDYDEKWIVTRKQLPQLFKHFLKK